MDHTEALRLQAAEKYLLNEFSEPQREEYEEHYFDCHDCAEDLKATAVFLESVRQLIREGILEPQMARQNAAVAAPRQTNRGFLAWLRPAFALPALAALLIFIGYQNGVTIPRLKTAESAASPLEVQKYVSLPPLGSRGDAAGPLVIKVGTHQSYVLEGDMPGNSNTGYLCQIQNPAGRVLYEVPISAEQAKDTVQLHIRGGALAPGSYELVIYKGQSSASPTTEATPSRIRFTVEFIP